MNPASKTTVWGPAVLGALAVIVAALIQIYAEWIREAVNMVNTQRAVGVGLIVAGIALLAVGLQLVLAQGPRIEFTRVPKVGAGPDSRGDIAGRVVGVSGATAYRIVLYAHTDVWYVQPLESDPFTTIAKDGQWSNWTHLGRRYGALLVRPSYRPGTRLQALPSEGGDILLKAEVPAAE